MDRVAFEARVRDIYRPENFGKRELFSADLVWHVPGDNPVSGEYRGDEYFTTMVERMSPLHEWAFTVKDVLFNVADRAALVHFDLSGKQRGVVIETDGYHLIRLTDDGLIREGWGFTRDQDQLDAFFSA